MKFIESSICSILLLIADAAYAEKHESIDNCVSESVGKSLLYNIAYGNADEKDIEFYKIMAPIYGKQAISIFLRDVAAYPHGLNHDGVLAYSNQVFCYRNIKIKRIGVDAINKCSERGIDTDLCFDK